MRYFCLAAMVLLLFVSVSVGQVCPACTAPLPKVCTPVADVPEVCTPAVAPDVCTSANTALVPVPDPNTWVRGRFGIRARLIARTRLGVACRAHKAVTKDVTVQRDRRRSVSTERTKIRTRVRRGPGRPVLLLE